MITENPEIIGLISGIVSSILTLVFKILTRKKNG